MTNPDPPETSMVARARARLKDVAALAEVSTKTAERVMKGNPTVDPELAEKVRRASEQLHYQPKRTDSNPRRSDARSETSTVTRARATLKDVAALAGVSVKTASRVINGNSKVDRALAERVQQASEQLHYQRNITAGNLRRGDGRSAAIGLLLEDIANPFSSSVYRAVEDVAVLRDVVLLAGSLDESPTRERQLATTLFGRRIDGLIIVPAGGDHRYLLNEQRAGTALVFVDRPPGYIATDTVLSDGERGASEGVAHLLEAGHKRVAYLGDRISIPTAQLRYQGYLSALADACIDPEPRLVRHDLHGIDAAQAAATDLLHLDEPPTALFTSQNFVTVGAIRALRQANKQHDTALVGFDDFMLADLLQPAVTVIAQDPPAMGKLAAEILFSRIEGDDTPPRQHVIATHLIARGSGEIPPPASR